ncbi:glycosyltransferase family 4 protein [Rubrivivax sp. RP6-9]|uniref:glycosyltransferase family 4 protein n=1 Tax=Rubrivivax sp. RP6-9 TaxID=3415750 RepID=UPI003CC60708
MPAPLDRPRPPAQQRTAGSGTDPAAALPPAGDDNAVVHLVSQLDADIVHLLGPATAALARSGSAQTVVLIDHPGSRPWLTQLDASAALVLVAAQRNPVAQWRALGAAFAACVAEQRPQVVHLHGFVACLLGERVLGALDSSTPAFYSPHGSSALGTLRPLATLAHLLGRSGRGAATARAIGHGTAEADGLQGRLHRSVALIEGPVDRAYFEVGAHAARHPLVVSASRAGDVRGAEAFDQLAVLLGGDALGLAFNWIGPVDAVAAARMHAAHVGVFSTQVHTERATRLAAAWMFVALASGRGFPLCLAEAMAAGLPCVALDTPAHRGVVLHGVTGYLCQDQAEVIARIAQLADAPGLRERLGLAGRALSLERFGQHRFEDTLLAAYGASAPRPAEALQPPPAWSRQDTAAESDRL